MLTARHSTAMPDTMTNPSTHPQTPPPTGRPAPAGTAFRALLAALQLLLCRTPPASGLDPRTARATIRWFVPIGALIGLAWAGVFRAMWRLYGEIGELRLVPALAIVLLEAIITGRYLLLALASVEDIAARRPDATDAEALEPSPAALAQPFGAWGILVLILSVVTQWTLLVSIPRVTPWWPPPEEWRSYFNFLYPQPIYRPLLLAPLWGRWAILLAGSIGRTARSAEPSIASLCAALTPGCVLRNALIPIILTCVYFSRERNFMIGAVIGLVVFAIAYLAGVRLAHRFGGQNRLTLLAAGQIAQVTFLAVYRAMWPVIHQ